MRRRMALVINGSDRGKKCAHVFESVFTTSRKVENEKIPQVQNMMCNCVRARSAVWCHPRFG
jgi:hypothetical protein